MSDTQFNHQIWEGAMGGQTTCIVVPSKDEFLATVFDHIELDAPILLDIGIAYCNDKDLYNKKVGRTMSKDRLTSIEFKFHSINIIDDLRYIKLKNECGIFTFRVNPNSDRVWFTEVI